jgi:hypothetical protein
METEERLEKMRAARKSPPTVNDYMEQFRDAGIGAKMKQQAKVRLEQMNASGRATYARVILGVASPRDRIKCFCVECMGYEKFEVAGCTDHGCPLYGERPQLQKRSTTPESGDSTPSDAS